MVSSSVLVRTVRIDVPLFRADMSAYLFVEQSHNQWDPWWESLWAYLLRILPSDISWKKKVDSAAYIAMPEFTLQQKLELLQFLRTAPAKEKSEHRTLKRAVELKGDLEDRLRVIYFGEKNVSSA